MTIAGIPSEKDVDEAIQALERHNIEQAGAELRLHQAREASIDWAQAPETATEYHATGTSSGGVRARWVALGPALDIATEAPVFFEMAVGESALFKRPQPKVERERPATAEAVPIKEEEWLPEGAR